MTTLSSATPTISAVTVAEPAVLFRNLLVSEWIKITVPALHPVDPRTHHPVCHRVRRW